MKPAIRPTNPKPTVGILLYGGKQVGNPAPFRNLGNLQNELIRQGYDKKLFRKTYYYGK